ncbi:hypothetical protein IJG04_02230 [Candidatus Saccharibacteria bacterium]|nr:hypothetical protein [Candidatus Saccharibacteria bacterium]
MESEDTTISKSGRGKAAAENSDSNTTTKPPTRTNNSTDTSTDTSTDSVPEVGENGEMSEAGGAPEMNCEESEDGTTNCEPPELPDGEEGMMGGPMGMGGGFPGEMTMQDGGASGGWHPVAYLAMGAGSLLLSMVIIYACFSKCFHKRPGETFNTASKFIWACVATLVLTVGLVTLCYFIPIWVG